MTKLDAKFIVNLRGKDFVTYDGLMELAHQIGLKSITTELIQIPSKDNGEMAIVKATVIDENDRMFEGYGDACPKSVTGMVVNHKLRMAETRAKARALRDLTNVGMTAIEELGGDEDAKTTNSIPGKTKATTKGSSDLASDKQLGFIYKLVKDKDYGADSMAEYIKKAFDKDSSKELTKYEASKLIEMLNAIGE